MKVFLARLLPGLCVRCTGVFPLLDCTLSYPPVVRCLLIYLIVTDYLCLFSGALLRCNFTFLMSCCGRSMFGYKWKLSGSRELLPSLVYLLITMQTQVLVLLYCCDKNTVENFRTYWHVILCGDSV